MRNVCSGVVSSAVHGMTEDTGLYVILVDVVRAVRVRWAGKETGLASGRYAYVGSARRGLRARVKRHLRREKPKKWHIDQLTTHRHATVVGGVATKRRDDGVRTQHGDRRARAWHDSGTGHWCIRLPGRMPGASVELRVSGGAHRAGCRATATRHLLAKPLLSLFRRRCW